MPPTTTTDASRARRSWCERRDHQRSAHRLGREERILEIIETTRAKRPRFKDERVTMAHGAGGKATQTLIEGLLAPALGGEALAALGDAGAVTVDGTGLAMTTDSFVVKPIRFPGGSIGELAVNGTVNDLAVSGRQAAGAQPVAHPRGGPRLRRAPGRGRGDRHRCHRGRGRGRHRRHQGRRARPLLTRCTSARPASARCDARASLSPASIEPGDRVLVSGTIGEHGTAIMLARGELGLDAEIASDTRSLWPAVDALLDAAGPSMRCMRDATRGGVASVLNELARASQVAIGVREDAVPVEPRGGRRGRAARHRPDVRRQRGRARRLRRPRRGRGSSGGASERPRAASRRPRSAR